MSLFRKLSKRFFILTNTAVALLYLLGAYGGFFFRAGWWPVGLLSLAAFYLFLILLLFLAFWLFAKRVWSLISVSAILLTLGPLQHLVPFRIAQPDFDPVPAAGDLRVMSWNVAQFDILYNKQRPDIRDNMLALINQYKPDVACFQEMVAGDTLVNLNTPYYRKYSFYSIFDYAEKLHFPQHFFSYHFKDDFLNHQHFGLVIFSRWPIIRRETLSFPPYEYNHNFQYADIVKAGDTIRVFNLHLQSLKFDDGNRAYLDNPTLESGKDLQRSRTIVQKLKRGFVQRMVQADRIRAAIEQSPYPVIVCGDFNDVPGSYAYQTIGRGLRNAFVDKGRGLGRTFAGIAPTLRIDNIFMSKAFITRQFTRPTPALSDHFPLIADLSAEKGQ